LIQTATFGLATLYRRRIAVSTKTASGMIGQVVPPLLWVLVLAPALDTALGSFNPQVDYYTYVALAQVAFLIPFTSMFSGINVIVDKDFGVLRELLVAPVFRAAIPLANALGVMTVALAQVAILVGFGILRGAEFDTSAAGVAWFLSACCLLSLSTYGIAETLALIIGRQEAYGPMIPAVGVTPWFLAGSLFPITLLPAGIEQVSLFLPWTHALALMRYGMMQDIDPGLADIWGMDSNGTMALLSLLALMAYTALTLFIAIRVFYRKSTS